MATNPIESVDGDGIVREVRTLVEDYLKPTIGAVAEPVTGVSAPVIIKGDAIEPVPARLFDDYRTAPRFRQGTAALTAIDSLIVHTNRFKDDHSILFADDDRAKPSITAVLDYHIAGAESAPRFGKHRSVFGFPLSDEWKAWSAKNAEPMSMIEFAAFLEDRIIDVLYLIPGEDELSEDIQRLVDALGGSEIIATPNKLMELARGLQVNENAIVQEAVNLATGEGVVRFQSEHTDAHGAPLKVPSLFMIGIPVFRNGWLYRVAARLRYRKSGGKIVFWYELWRLDRTFDHAFKEAVAHVEAETGLPVLFGRPEA